MKLRFRILPYTIRLLTIIAIVLFIVIIYKIWNINNGYESNFIEQVPYFNEGLEQQKIHYDALIKLYQSRRTNISWMIALFGATMTFLAFWVQTRANYNQREDLNKQKEDLANERYENKLFHLLDIYRDICHNTKIDKVGEGKIAFHYMFYEYKAIYYIIKYKDYIYKELLKSDNETINYLAFTYFINGVTPNMIETSIIDGVITKKGKELIRDELIKLQQKSENNTWTDIKETPYYLRDYSYKKIKYFDGHRPRFVPYIKYIRLILDFIKAPTKTTKTNDYNYINFLIKEQTDHEIGLIYAYNRYIKYISDKDPLKKLWEDNNISHNDPLEKLWGDMYNDISHHMEHRFKFDNADFLSKEHNEENQDICTDWQIYTNKS